MDHLAIMNPAWKLIPKILTGQKTIESRWYKARFSPWNKIKTGDTIYFKDSGKPVTVKAKVAKVLQFDNLDLKTVTHIVKKYAKQIYLQDTNYKNWTKTKKYCILIFLKNPQKIKPFNIDKTGFGSATAWLTLKNINRIKKLP